MKRILSGDLHPGAADEFNDVYSLEFADLPSDYSEADLHGALLRHLGRFITELMAARGVSSVPLANRLLANPAAGRFAIATAR